MSIDFDALEFELPDDDFDSGATEITPVPGLTLTSPVKTTTMMPAAFPAREALELVEEPEVLFDFKGTSLSPVQQMYILGFAVRGTKLGACKLAGVAYRDVEKWMESEEFRSTLQAAVDMARDSLEEELIRRAMRGSDRLLLEAVKASKPEKYAPKKMDVVAGKVEHVHSWADLAKEATKVIDITGEAEEK